MYNHSLPPVTITTNNALTKSLIAHRRSTPLFNETNEEMSVMPTGMVLITAHLPCAVSRLTHPWRRTLSLPRSIKLQQSFTLSDKYHFRMVLTRCTRLISTCITFSRFVTLLLHHKRSSNLAAQVVIGFMVIYCICHHRASVTVRKWKYWLDP